MKLKPRIMYIEHKGDGISGPARIGLVTFSKSGKSIYYQDRRFHTLAGSGFKANYFDWETGEQYWISGCKKRGADRLYSGTKSTPMCASSIGKTFASFLKTNISRPSSAMGSTPNN
jgi:hypothetical protein